MYDLTHKLLGFVDFALTLLSFFFGIVFLMVKSFVFDLIDMLWMIQFRVILLIRELFNFGFGSASVPVFVFFNFLTRENVLLFCFPLPLYILMVEELKLYCVCVWLFMVGISKV